MAKSIPPQWYGMPLLEIPQKHDPDVFEALKGNMMRIEWCGGIFHPRDQAVEQGEWIFHH